MLAGMRIHRIPIVLDGRVLGVVTALDVVRAVAEERSHEHAVASHRPAERASRTEISSAITAKLSEARGACEQLGHDEVASIVGEAHGARLRTGI